MTNSFTLSLIAVAVGIGSATAVEAQLIRSAKVGYADINLSSRAGQAVLTHRIQGALNRICGDADPRDLGAQADRARCRKDALAGTRPQIDAAIGSTPSLAMASRPLGTVEIASGSPR